MKYEVEKLLRYVQKPARYTGGELNSVIKDKNNIDIRYAFCFPDTYEIGMSHLGMRILYSLINSRPYAWCERVFAPDLDMEEQLRKASLPLFALESGDPISDFDFIGFTLQYELSYTNMLNMLDLAGLPVRACERKTLTPIVVAGGPCACNPEPLADFVDIFSLGEGEEVTLEILDLLRECKKKGLDKSEFLALASKIEGVYVPSLYDVSYNGDGTVRAVTPVGDAPEKVKKRIISNLDECFYPDKFVVPFIDIVHDRAVEEIFRGCIRGCRFCQAGFIYRPVREKSTGVINRQAKALCDSSGYDEISLCSLSASDHSEIQPMLSQLLDWASGEKINVSLPSLRIDNFSNELLTKLQAVRKSGLTFAPEAGTQRLRDVINKNITDEEIISAVGKAFSGGRTSVKLYFMLGLPAETVEDIDGIAELAQRIVDEFYKNPDRPKGRGVSVGISASTFVPKPFTPFQWEAQDTMDAVEEKQKRLLSAIRTKKINLSYHKSPVSLLEGVLARGDRRLGRVIEYAWRNGCKFDGWDERFNFDVWTRAFEEYKLDMSFYANRKRDFNEVLPWDHLDYGVKRKFLENENIKAHNVQTTANCRERCAACGANGLNGGKCDAMR